MPFDSCWDNKEGSMCSMKPFGKVNLPIYFVRQDNKADRWVWMKCSGKLEDVPWMTKTTEYVPLYWEPLPALHITNVSLFTKWEK